ncbi:VirD4-like conjugal transfer protein, CD1115 family [Ethanoligenens harbinense]|jgi:type IV secretion system protein VirD4|uniref:TRAG family protein n=1 Tax=Ethanoligenens harbinense (strain DSM 18485 / JCM 12961 / CGMCC 1.5033 / YUAN-3) TaxID=663278 RepID=E6U9K7_ETHHY|nr:type IV secretory system conjugative DNA transfer family protein [Ethanoligenens harbinense]ADU27293.1 TRAG family protein [Ethanoligenens harbinense YUAN-3]AVQ96357.1 conjugal transfer protein TraG [Ethanoligenens harbinense YUAN-3]AYF39015.1 conjugal transfer protein TraG [Ethanoligenens harbinense]AYF41841.1 conjugal transfer protein TraG [Ethanoligenens harbinense]QCN92598.1 type IV secretory system conjugative DNA transfer family protein [Ethanoligenens harbinense]
MSDKIRRFVLPNVPYLFIFWCCLKLCTAYRLAAGDGFGEKLIGMIKTIGPAFQTIAPGLVASDWLIGLVGAVILRLVVWYKIKNAKKFRKDVEYGSARWGTPKDIKPFIDPVFKNNVILTGTEFLTMNTRPKNPANARNLNCCIIGSSGSGKTRFWLTPQLLQAHSSYVVVDPKGGILGQVGAFLKRQGYKIKVFNSIDFARSMHYNPLSYIKTESDILKFVNALITNTKGDGKEGDEFWTKAETLLYCALVAYIVFEGPEEERNMNTLVDMINSMEVKEDDDNFKNAVDYMFMGLEKRNPNHFAVRQYKKYKLASGKTAKSILISCGARLAPFDIPQLREIMSYDELELDRMGDRKTATFFIISDTDTTYNFIVALAFSQMFNLLCERADNKYGGRLPHHVRVLWDEAANTGQVPQLEKLVAVIRSREISLCLFLQAEAQLKALYKDNAETILGNMDSVIFLGGREHTTVKELSEALGKETISMYTESVTRGMQESHGQNLQRLGKELMTIDELTTMDGSKCILQLRGLRPFLSPKYDLKKHPNYKYTAEADKRNSFDISSLIDRRMKVKPDEIYTVYEVDAPGEDAAAGEDEDILNYDDVDDPDAFA